MVAGSSPAGRTTKLILSRKGFDSGVANCASPILPDGAMVSLPIPLASAPIGFDDVAWRGRSLGPIVAALSRGRVGASDRAHLDPDLAAAARPRRSGWRPSFGQVGAAQTHLSAHGVGPGDLFLFFGWFRGTDEAGARFRPAAPDEHVIFGWLQIGQILRIGEGADRFRAEHPWLDGHPHLHAHAVPSNTVYVASDRLVLAGRDMGVAGGGVFERFHPGLRLTAPGRSRSIWRLPGWLHPTAGSGLSYHRDPAAWGDPGDTVLLQSAKQGQEFVACVDSALLAGWVAELLAGCHTGPLAPMGSSDA